jgi:hypothetical protein
MIERLSGDGLASHGREDFTAESHPVGEVSQNTPTPTNTPTSTPTSTPTNTPTQRPTSTPNTTPTNTPTGTPTQTPTVRPTGTPTATATAPLDHFECYTVARAVAPKGQPPFPRFTPRAL